MFPAGTLALPAPGPHRRITLAMALHAVSCACLLLVSWRTSRIGRRKLTPMESGPVATVLSMRGGSEHVNSASAPMVSTHASDTLLSGSLNLRQTDDTIRGR